MKGINELAIALITVYSLASSAAAAESSYETLEQYCNATNADTPANCACGQAKAEELLTPDERRLVLGLMMEDPAALGEMAELGSAAMQELMGKVELITAGCN